MAVVRVQEKLGAELLSLLDYRRQFLHRATIGFQRGAGRNPTGGSLPDRWLVAASTSRPFFYWEARQSFSLMLHYHGRLPDRRARAPSMPGPHADERSLRS